MLYRYGDRTPRSFPAKCLAILWMITGCTVFPILTSCLVSGLTALSLDDSNLKLYGMKVGKEKSAFGSGDPTDRSLSWFL